VGKLSPIFRGGIFKDLGRSRHEGIFRDGLFRGGIFLDNFAGAEFIFTVTTAGADTFTLPLEAVGDYDFEVDWGDDSSDVITVWNQAEATHSYSGAGTFTVTIQGVIKGFRFNDSGDKTLIDEIQNWGSLQFNDTNGFFFGCSNLTITATDSIPLAGLTTLLNVFQDCASIVSIPNLNVLNTSSVIILEGVFQGCTLFNQNIGAWDVSNVTNMALMFSSAPAFNQDISGWNTGNVSSFRNMFVSATSFNQDISGWNTESAQLMQFMFWGATAFDQNIGAWDIGVCTNMSNMFFGVTLSTANYDSILRGWEGQPHNGLVFHGGNSKYTKGSLSHTARINLTTAPDTWTITDGGMAGDLAFKFEVTVAGAGDDLKFTLPLESSGTYDFNVDWGDSSDDDITVWNQAETTHAFAGAGTYDVVITGQCEGWNFDTNNQFGSDDKLEDISNWGTLLIDDTQYNFFDCDNMTVSATDYLILQYQTDMTGIFESCDSLTGIPAMSSPPDNRWDWSSILDTTGMFDSCVLFNQEVDLNTENCLDFTWMFFGNTALNSVITLDLTSATSIESMFEDSTSFNQAFGSSSPDLIDARYVFYNCSAFNSDVNLTWESILSIRQMFFATSFDRAIDFDLRTTGVANIDARGVFQNTPLNSAVTITVHRVTQMDDFFTGCVSQSVANWSNFLIDCAGQIPSIQSGVQLDAEAQHNSGGTTAIASLSIPPYNWIITDGGLSP